MEGPGELVDLRDAPSEREDGGGFRGTGVGVPVELVVDVVLEVLAELGEAAGEVDRAGGEDDREDGGEHQGRVDDAPGSC